MMFIIETHLQAVTKALLDKDSASIGALLDEIGRLQDRIKELVQPLNAPHSEALKLQAENERLKEALTQMDNNAFAIRLAIEQALQEKGSE